MASEPAGTVSLVFDPERLAVGDSDLRHGLSALALGADRLWVACDEGCRIEQLSRTRGGFARHRVFPLEDLLTLPADPSEEADIEGLDTDDGWLWLVGSHSVKRKKPKQDDEPEQIARKLATTTRDGNRHLLARIPLVGSEPTRTASGRRALSLRATAESSELLDVMLGRGSKGADRHLAPFVPLPGKDNGLDIEGLAVRGRRVFVGLRGPVLREWCCILELLVDADGDHLRLQHLSGAERYRKHFLKLNGLGIRDLVALDDDLLILAGPSMSHDGPHEIWRWPRALAGRAPSVASAKRVVSLPPREQVDRAEGMSHFAEAGDDAVLIVFDTPSPHRLRGASGVVADVYRVG